ncbi:MAG: putative lipid II flippase FtsW [Clostridia bacterium]|nr:putative lipid II flippase FtsW [Clostridia bacterium]
MRYSKSTARDLSVKPFLSLGSSPSERFYRVLNGKIVVLTLGIALFGLLMIYSASSYVAKKNFGDSFYYVKKQTVALFVGTAAMFGVSRVKTQTIKKIRYVILAVSFLLLVVIFIPGLGVESYGARRWINLGFMTMQPSEIAKFGYVVFASSYLSEKGIGRWRDLFVVGGVGAAMCVLIMLEPNMSITMCVLCVMLFMLLVGGIEIKKLALLALPILAAIPLLIFLEPYRLKRLAAFLDPWASPKGEGYQLIQSYYALCRGGFFGVGLFGSRQKYLFLPFAESDFIFSVIGEELGLFGAVFVMTAFGALICFGFQTAWKARDRFDALLSAGITSVIAVQTAVNLCVVTGCIPPTGLPLPLVSAGGSSLVSFMTAIGVLLSINRKGGNFAGDDHKM